MEKIDTLEGLPEQYKFRLLGHFFWPLAYLDKGRKGQEILIGKKDKPTYG